MRQKSGNKSFDDNQDQGWQNQGKTVYARIKEKTKEKKAWNIF